MADLAAYANGARRPIEAEATYQGYPCRSAEFSATPGDGANTGTVVLVARSAAGAKIETDGILFRNVDRPQQGTRVRFPDLPPARKGPRGQDEQAVTGELSLAPFGTLVLSSTVGTVEIERLMPISIEPVDEAADGLTLYRVQLATVATMWGSRGALFGDFNHRTPDGGPIVGDVTLSLQGHLERVAAALAGVGNLTFSKGTLKILERPLPEKSAPQAEAEKVLPLNTRWRFSRPDEALASLSEKFGLVPVLLQDGKTLRMYAIDEGLQSPQELGIPADLYHAIPAPVLSLVPDSVLVVGAARQREVLVQFTGDEGMVGREADFDGLAILSEDRTIVEAEKAKAPKVKTPKGTKDVSREHDVGFIPWGKALETYNLTKEEAGRWILLPAEKQAEMLAQRTNTKVESGTKLAEQLRSWLFRAYRLPERNSTLLPMLMIAAGPNGEEEEPKVWTSRVSERSGVKDRPSGRAWVNVEDVPATDCRFDLARGIVWINSELPPGVLRATNVDALEQGTLYPPTNVTVMFRSERKGGRLLPKAVPGAPYAVGPRDYFRFAVERAPSKAGGGPSKASEVEPDDLSTTPLVIHAPELVELTRIDGTSNVEELRERAAAMALPHLSSPAVRTSWRVDAIGMHPVWADGAVKQVTWRVGPDGPPMTTVVIGSSRMGEAPTYATKSALTRVRLAALEGQERVAPAQTSIPQGRRR